MRKAVALLICVLLSLPCVFAARAETTLTFWTNSQSRADDMAERARQWNALEPSRPVRLDTTVYSADMIDEKLWTVLHSGVLVPGVEPPDMADVEYQNLPKYINPLNCLFYPLDSILEGAPKETLEAYCYRGMCFGVPADSGEMAVLCRRAALDEAGIDPAAMKTWNDFRAAARKYYEKTGKPFFAVDMDHYLAFLTVYLQIAARDGEQAAHAGALHLLAAMFDAKEAGMMPGGRVDSRGFREAFTSGEAACAFVRRADVTVSAEEAYLVEIPTLDGSAEVWMPGYATCVTTFCEDYALVMAFLAFAQPVQARPSENALRPGNAERVLDSLNRYELQLASLVLDGGKISLSPKN